MKNCCVVLLMFLPFLAFTQSRVYVKAVAGNYRMGDMKEFQREWQKDYDNMGVHTKAVAEFPVSLQVDAGMDFSLDEGARIGFFINYATTYGRLYYADYSGETSGKQNLKRVAFGFRAALDIVDNFEAYGKIGLGLNSMDLLHETSITGAASTKDEIQFNALGAVIEPGIQWRYPYHRFAFALSAGYEFSFNGKTKLNDDTNAYLTNNDGKAVLIDWSGIRVGGGIYFSLFE
jgi:hypothetical protein